MKNRISINNNIYNSSMKRAFKFFREISEKFKISFRKHIIVLFQIKDMTYNNNNNKMQKRCMCTSRYLTLDSQRLIVVITPIQFIIHFIT